MNTKNVRRSICLMLFLSPPIALAQDHLEPEVGIMYADKTSYEYCQNLNELFFSKSPSDYLARMFCRPGFGKPQWCVTVYKDKKQNCVVEFIVAEKSIDHKKDSLSIKVKRESQPIDLETAQIVQVVFRQMLRGVRYSDQEKQAGDGDEFNFSRNVLGWDGFDQKLGEPPLGSEQGLIYDPEVGSLTEKLVKIGDELKRFATTASNNEARNTIRAEIRRQAKELMDKATIPQGGT
ncbi:hypothetical protein P12x_003270 [Tundrisphaera lichenicola]|uniref:hypothetical protein n=1 Tax=Tundrisphaera lichenicola TaxID=2029860 RepID=UPI003EB8970D